MKTRTLLALLTCVLILASSIMAQARLIPNWSEQDLLDKSDLVVIGTPTASSDTQERTELPGLASQQVIGVETGFAVSAVVKGDRTLKNFVLHHYRADEGIVPNGPCLVAFKPEEKRTFLLYIKREADGRYAPTVGQVDPAMQGITALCLGSIAIADTSVAVLNPPSRVKGRLGKPLGSRIVIEGVFAERMMMGNPLLVSVVDGEAVKQPVAVEIHDKVQIEKGKQYRLEGYESGAFGGPPDWTVGEGIPQQPFQFYSFFVVTKVLEPERESLAADQINAERAGRNFEYFKKYLAACPETQVRCLWFLRENVGIGMVMTIDLREATVHTVRDVFDHARQNSKTRDMSHAQTFTARELLAKLPGGAADLSFPEGLHISFWHEKKLHTYTYSKKTTPLIVQRLYDVGGGENDFTYEE